MNGTRALVYVVDDDASAREGVQPDCSQTGHFGGSPLETLRGELSPVRGIFRRGASFGAAPRQESLWMLQLPAAFQVQLPAAFQVLRICYEAPANRNRQGVWRSTEEVP
jgi:hypothetical protein